MRSNRVKKFVHEPLVHFLLLGAAIFAAYTLMNRGISHDPERIVITQGQIASIQQGFVLTRQRPPTREELEGLIRDRVREEVYYREALALGLDQDDIIIRRRLQQKMEFVSEGRAAVAEPGGAELQAYLNANAASFATEPSFSFRQLYLDPQRHGATLVRDAERLRDALRPFGAEANLARRGDPFQLEREINHASAREVAKLFGDKFAAALRQLPVGQWQGPIESGYGAHVVFLTARTEGGVPPLADVREAVRRDWTRAQQREAAANSYQALLNKYAVIIESPSAAATRVEPVAVR